MSDLHRDLLDDFLLEARERTDRVEAALLALREAGPSERPELLREVKRELHTLKGNSGMMGLTALQAQAHEMEDAIESLGGGETGLAALLAAVDRLRHGLAAASEADGGTAQTAPGSPPPSAEGPRAASGLRLASRRLDDLLDLVGECLTARNRLRETLTRGRPAAESGGAWREIDRAAEQLDRSFDRLQEGLLELRMVPLRNLYPRLQRIAYDAADGSGRELRFSAEGGTTALDKALIEPAAEALGHLVRNAVVHGIEPPEVRRELGKPPVGTLLLAAAVGSGMVEIDVVDDGAGMDRDALLASARRLGHDPDPAGGLHSLVFLPGVSTRSRADLAAGRGVGLDAVLSAVRRVGGTIDVASEPGQGTHFRMRLPLRVSITRALMLHADGEEYALPVASILETVAFDRAPAPAGGSAPSTASFAWRGEQLELVDLGVAFGTAVEGARRRYVVVVAAEGRPRGLLVDGLGELREIVVKPLDLVLGESPGLSGSTVLGDGRVVMIVDPAGLGGLETAAAGG